MKKSHSALFVKSAFAMALAVPMLASAESSYVTGSATSTPGAQADLDFRIIIPKVLLLQVGSNDANVNLVTFDYTNNPAAVGTGAAASNITGNVVPVRVIGNNGQITLTATTSGALTNATADTIPWSEISASSSVSALPSPLIPNIGIGAASNVTLSSGTKITNQSADWTFSYANSTVVAPGTYGTTNGRVTYTAAMP